MGKQVWRVVVLSVIWKHRKEWDENRCGFTERRELSGRVWFWRVVNGRDVFDQTEMKRWRTTASAEKGNVAGSVKDKQRVEQNGFGACSITQYRQYIQYVLI